MGNWDCCNFRRGAFTIELRQVLNLVAQFFHYWFVMVNMLTLGYTCIV